ncbi:hypothetical protein HanXRQr2_Chr12g0534211 [Helianthus annuus]|uniref:Uncharacterized protein n=1 Tax=Helianthus annuus TaxID=4232 RepID=A0A9K3HFE4_HELAN|nr:hypothetical protein HanXRQr2_Chr12g0534211 [Helianthus annuus]KAJ0862124.1 hypothetical protein HanPSC8_Chr12g0514501 [Helianthus annuus]
MCTTYGITKDDEDQVLVEFILARSVWWQIYVSCKVLILARFLSMNRKKLVHANIRDNLLMYVEVWMI